MEWKVAPRTGSVLIRAIGLDGGRVELNGPARLGGETDGDGLFGLAAAPPGRYDVAVRHPSLAEPRQARVEVRPGMVAELELR
jgi:hypothetical protein